LESSESYKAASQRASLEVEKLRAENEDLKQQLDAAGSVTYCTVLGLSITAVYYGIHGYMKTSFYVMTFIK